MPLDGRKAPPNVNPAAWSTTPQYDSVDTEILLVRQYAQGPNGPLTLYADPQGPLDAVTLEYLDAALAPFAQLFTGLNPPANPTPGQLWWDPQVAQLFIWYQDPNSSQWVIANNTGIQEAPVGTTLYGPVAYGRENRTWVPVLALSGGIMTGSLVLAWDPTVPLEAATKGYVDGSLQNAMLGYLPLSGGTMLGPLILSGDPTGALQAATKEYVDANSSVALVADAPPTPPIQGRLWFDSVSALLFIWYDDGESAQWVQVNTPGANGGSGGGPPTGIFLPLAGGTMTGDLFLASSPTATSPGNQAATKDYVDFNAGSAYLPIGGGTLTGNLQILVNPVASLLIQGANTGLLALNGGNNAGILFQQGNTGEWAITADYSPTNLGLHITRFSQPVISIDPVSLKITGGYFSTTAGDPVLANDLARKAYVDSLFAASTFFIGAVNASTGFCTYTVGSGFPNGALVDASLVQPGSYLICVQAGNAIPAGDMEVGDWLISDGTTWNVLHLGQAAIMAANVGVAPEVNGTDNVQDALESLDVNKLTVLDAARLYLPITGGTLTGDLWVTNPGVGTGEIRISGDETDNQRIRFRSGGLGRWMIDSNLDHWRVLNYTPTGAASGQPLTIESDNRTVMTRPQSSWVPSSNTDLTNRAYVDAGLAGYVPITGGVMTGFLQTTMVQIINQGEAVLRLSGDIASIIAFRAGGTDLAPYWWFGMDHTGTHGITADSLVAIRFPNPGSDVGAEVDFEIDYTTGDIIGRNFRTLNLNPTDNNELVPKQYVDDLFTTGIAKLIGVFEAPTDTAHYGPGLPFPNPGPLVAANLVDPGSYLICDQGGTMPPGSVIPGMTFAVGDWVLSDGATWIQLAVGTADLLASNVGVAPAIAGANNVQAALTNLNNQMLTQALGDARYFQLTGGTITGNVTIQKAAPFFSLTNTGTDRITLDFAGPAGQDYFQLYKNSGSTGLHLDRFPDGGTAQPVFNVVRATGAFNMLGNTMLTLTADPTTALQAATKQYADRMLPLAGGTMTGGLSFGSTAQASPTDLTRHIALWGATTPTNAGYGFSITSSTLNIVANPASSHVDFYVAGNSKVAELNATELVMQGNRDVRARAFHCNADNQGLEVNGGGWFYKATGTGLVLRNSSGNQQPQIEDNSGATNTRRAIMDTRGGTFTGGIIINAGGLQINAGNERLLSSSPGADGGQALTWLDSASRATGEIRTSQNGVVSGNNHQGSLEFRVNNGSGIVRVAYTRYGAAPRFALDADPVNPEDAATKRYVDATSNAGPWQTPTMMNSFTAVGLRCRWIFGPTVSVEIEGRVNSPGTYTGTFIGFASLPTGLRPIASNIQYLVSCYQNGANVYGYARLVISSANGQMNLQPVSPAMTGNCDFYLSGIMAPLN